jgi:sialic acid synthase SpsE
MNSRLTSVIKGTFPDTYVIAEAGLNHNGSIQLAKEIIDIAARSGADAVKFQKRTVSQLAIKSVLEQEDLRFPSFGKTYGEIREFLEFDLEQYRFLQEYATAQNLEFLVTPFDKDAIEFLRPLNLNGYKVASHSVRNVDFLSKLAKESRPIIMSTGMSTLSEIDTAVDIWRANKVPFCLLHCVSAYPTLDTDAQLRVIASLHERYKVSIGYSGHEMDSLTTLVAVSLGARIIERHVTISRNLEGFDHKLSLEEDELTALINNVRRIEKMMGSPDKTLLPAELIAREKYNVSMVSKTRLEKGHVLDLNDIAWKNPGTGIPSSEMQNYLGRVIAQDVPEDVLFSPDMFR